MRYAIETALRAKALPHREVQPAAVIGNSAPLPGELLVFLHIPKTGGTTLDRILHGIANLQHRPSLRIPVAAHAPAVFITPRWQGAWSAASNSSEAAKQTAGVISGHFPYGVHHHLDAPCSYITLLRDPVDREISSFRHHLELGHLRGADSIESLIADRRIMDNPQTRLLAGADACLAPHCSEDMFRTARSRIEQDFLLVGVLEHFEQFLAALLGLYDWPGVRYRPAKVSTAAPPPLSPAARDSLERYHSFDRLLHRQAGELWRKRWEQCFQYRADIAGPLLSFPWHYEITGRCRLQNHR